MSFHRVCRLDYRSAHRRGLAFGSLLLGLLARYLDNRLGLGLAQCSLG